MGHQREWLCFLLFLGHGFILKSPELTLLRRSIVLLIGNFKDVQPGFLHVTVANLGSKNRSYDFFLLICLCMCVHMCKYTQEQAAGRWPVSLVINQMSHPNENTIPGHNLGNTYCYRNLMHAWKRPTVLKEGEKSQP